jgi:hypothetical protein
MMAERSSETSKYLCNTRGAETQINANNWSMKTWKLISGTQNVGCPFHNKNDCIPGRDDT